MKRRLRVRPHARHRFVLVGIGPESGKAILVRFCSLYRMTGSETNGRSAREASKTTSSDFLDVTNRSMA
jgi:hypothetical protein